MMLTKLFIKLIHDIHLFVYLSVRERSFDPRPGLLQCLNCQRFENFSLFSHQPSRCVRCGRSHRGCTLHVVTASCKGHSVVIAVAPIRLPIGDALQIHKSRKEAAGRYSTRRASPCCLPYVMLSGGKNSPFRDHLNRSQPRLRLLLWPQLLA